MSRFFVQESDIVNSEIRINGTDFNHIKNVLRKKPGDCLTVCSGNGTDYLCKITEIGDGSLTLSVISTEETHVELPVRLVLYQGLPKADKMELIIQKAVELGAYRIVPVENARSVMKLSDGNKAERKIARWNTIAEGAAKQSGRGFVPEVSGVLSFPEAVKQAKERGRLLLPYENAEGMAYTREVICGFLKELSGTDREIGIFIGPEGGFSPREVELAEENGASVVSLGRRILRTETAGLCILSALMLYSELLSEEKG